MEHPGPPRRWLTWDEVAGVFDGRGDPDWEQDRQFLDEPLLDPWERAARRRGSVPPGELDDPNQPFGEHERRP